MKQGVSRMADRVFSDQILGERDSQEDAVAHRVFDSGDSVLVVLADGMGGHKGGEVASQTSVDAFISAFFNDFPSLKVPYRLFGALERANKELETLCRKNADLEGMGSTLVATLFSPAGLSWISVGDSLLFRVRGKTLHRLNEDHSMAPVLDEAVKKGTLTRELAASHRDRNALRAAVTGGSIDLVDIADYSEPLHTGDVIILASDGLLTLENEEIIRVVSAQKAAGSQAIVGKLLEAVREKKRRRQDNTTIAAIVIDRPSNRDLLTDRARSSTRASGAAAFIFSMLFAVGVGLGLSLLKPVSDFLQVISKQLVSSRAFLTDKNKIDSEGADSVDISGPATPENTSGSDGPAPRTSETQKSEEKTSEVEAASVRPQGSEARGPNKEEKAGDVGSVTAPPLGDESPKENGRADAVPSQSVESSTDVKYPKNPRSEK
jgi:serine/threonine protein phosphatase PrpC